MHPAYVLLLLVTTAAGLFLAGTVSRFRHAPGAQPLMILMLAAAEWSAGYALELSSQTPEAKLFWAKAQYLGIVSIPVCWFFFSIYYLDPPKGILKLRAGRSFLLILPGVTLGLVLTNELHRLIWLDHVLYQAGPVQLLEFSYGPWFWINWFYSYFLLLSGSIWLAGKLYTTNRLHRWQIVTALAAILVPWIGNLIYVTHLNPVRDFDWTPVLFTISGLLFAISLFRFHLIQVVPIAHKNVIQDLADGILVLDSQGDVVDFNPALQRILNLSGRQILGRGVEAALPGQASLFQELGRSQEYKGEICLGEPPNACHYEIAISPLVENNQTPLGRLVTLHDITQQKQAQVNLQRSHQELETKVLERTEALVQANEQLKAELAGRNLAEKRFQEIFNSAPDAILLVAPNGTIILANNQSERIFGYSKDELYDQNVEVLLPERFRTGYREYLAQFFTGPAQQAVSVPADIHAIDRDGREFPVEVSLNPLKIAEGLLAACTVRDIRERRRAENAHRESESLYRALFEHANDAIFLVGMERDILQVNQKAAELLGYSREELAGMFISDFISPQEDGEFKEKQQALLDGQNVPIYECFFRHKTDSVFPVNINLSLVDDSQGKPRFFQAIIRNITERKQAEADQIRLLQEVEQSREQLRALAARLEEAREIERRQIAAELHDRVGQNLTGLNLNLQIIQNNGLIHGNSAVQSRLEDSLNLVEETTRQVRNVMTDLNPPMLDEYGLVSTLHWYGNKFANRTGIAISITADELEPRLPPRVEIALFRIVQEILNNVAKHARATQVSILLERFDEAVCLSVEDNGLGFDLSSIHQGDDGSHWGLITMQERAISIGGELKVNSTPGRGATVTVEIRRERDEN